MGRPSKRIRRGDLVKIRPQFATVAEMEAFEADGIRFGSLYKVKFVDGTGQIKFRQYWHHQKHFKTTPQ